MNYSREDQEFFNGLIEQNATLPAHQKIPIPAPFLAKPKISLELEIFLEAFSFLSLSRLLYPGGLGAPGQIGYIPLIEIEAYCRVAEISDRLEFFEIIRYLDGIYVKFQNDKLTPKQTKK